jgi:hypothetical protein
MEDTMDRCGDATCKNLGERVPEDHEHSLYDPGDVDLPAGYRWATEEETEVIGAGVSIEHLVVPRTVDSQGRPYTQNEADIAIPIEVDGPEKWVPEAIDEQEAYLARRRAEKEAEREQRRIEADQ